MDHTMMRVLLITSICEMAADKYKISVKEAREKLYRTGVAALIEDDENGLYGDSPVYLFSQFENRIMKS